MSKMKDWSKYAAAYAAWIIAFFLWLWFLLVSWETVKGLMLYFMGSSFQATKTQQFLERAYVFVIGIAWLAIMIVTESYFRHGIKKGDLARRVGRFMGVEVILIFIADFILAMLLGLNLIPWSRWLILLLELVAASGLIWIGFIRYKTVRPKTGNIE